MKLRSRAVMFVMVAVSALMAAAAVSAGVVDIAQSPLAQSVSVGAVVDVKIVVSSPGPGGQPWDALDAIISWDPTYLKLTGSSQVGAGAPFFLTGFLPDPDGVNMNIMDGTAIFTALGLPGGNIVAPPAPAQLVVTTLKFLALAPTPATPVDYLPTIGMFGKTRALLGGFDVTGDTSSVAFVEIIGGCPPSSHNCFTVGPAGCSDVACCDDVCAIAPFCCTLSWDGTCVSAASNLCDGCGDPAAGDCCAAHADPFCDDRTCCLTVCDGDPFCCASAWDSNCAIVAFQACDCPCPESPHNCFTAGVPGCADDACCDVVCGVDGYCCVVAWDITCIGEASTLCDGCGDPAAGSCCAVHGTPFCDNRTCCNQVCAIDPFCCGTAWDDLCVAETLAFPACGCDPCLASNDTCFSTHATPGCDDTACCTAVCAADPSCCATAWDIDCKDAANVLCGGCGNPLGGSCFCPHPNKGCNNTTCCRTVCEIDPFCCEVQWDGTCATEANTLCTCKADFNNDGIVDGGDLGLLLAAWNTTQCPFDLNNSGNVDGADLGIFLAAWGPCP